jgi:hypothetical protein
MDCRRQIGQREGMVRRSRLLKVKPQVRQTAGDQVKAPAGPGVFGHMLEMSIDLFFRQREALGQFQSRTGLLPEQLPDGLAESKHKNCFLFSVFYFRKKTS